MQERPHPVMTLTKPPAAHVRLWRALRVLKTTDAVMLGLAARTAETTAREFLGLLVRGGYAAIAVNHKKGRVRQYRLVRDTGPQPPKRAIDVLVDGNSGALFGLMPSSHCGLRPCRVPAISAERQAELAKGRQGRRRQHQASVELGNERRSA